MRLLTKFVNIGYIFLLARRAYSWLFQLAQMWKLLAPGVGLVDFLTPEVVTKACLTVVPKLVALSTLSCQKYMYVNSKLNTN
jgi:hypothetical protein